MRFERLAYPSALDSFLEQLAVNSFINGLVHVETQRELPLAHSKNRDEALVSGLVFEAVKQTSKEYACMRNLYVQDKGLEASLQHTCPVRKR